MHEATAVPLHEASQVDPGHTVDDPPSFGSLARRGVRRGELAWRVSSRSIELGTVDHSMLDDLDDCQPGMATETIEIFVGQVPESLARIDEAYGRGDAVALHRLFRSLGTSARAVGAVHLAGLSQAAADLAREGDLEAVPGLAAEIEQEYGQVFRSLMDRHPSRR